MKSRTWNRVTTFPFVLLIMAYRCMLRPFMGGYCRFEPSCSQYALDALQLHGVTRGVKLTVGRIFRCRPGTAPGLDPVPPPRATDET
ncbi:MAG: membrane protein insertion efficiency factor YidD [Phycisphaerae bacterium]